MVSKILKVAVVVPGSLALTSYGLYAVSDREPKGERLSPHQLSLYSAPPRESRFIEERPGRAQHVFSALCSGVSPILSGGKSICVAVKSGVLETVQFGKDSYEYLKAPPPEFLPRVGVIAVGGLAGVVLARRGSRLKKVLYPGALAALGASLCYPAQAVIFAKVTGRPLSDWRFTPPADLSDHGQSHPEDRDMYSTRS
ncbi:MICOS complex subunit MIC27 [Gastrophryne carolinensis]